MNEIQASISSLEMAVEALSVSHNQSVTVLQSLNQVYQYLDLEWQIIIEEI